MRDNKLKAPGNSFHSDEGDLYENIETRPGTTKKQKETGRGAYKELLEAHARWAGKLSETPNPMSSMRTITTLGASFGAFTSNRAGGVAFRTSSSAYFVRAGSLIGKIVRSNSPFTGTCSCLGVFAVHDTKIITTAVIISLK